MGFEPTDPCGSNDFESCSHLVLSCLLWSVAAVLETAKILVLQRISDAPTGIDQLHIKKTRVQIEMRNAPKQSIFLRAGKKTCKKKTLVRYGFADSPPDLMQEKPAQNKLYEAPFRTETQKGVFVMKYDAKEFKRYPEIMSKEQMRIACHISKRTALYLLQFNLIPHTFTGKKTRCYAIKKSDVIAFMNDREVNPEKYIAPKNWYKYGGEIVRPYKIRIQPPCAKDEKKLRRYYESKLAALPDVMDVAAAVDFTGYNRRTVCQWIRVGKLKALALLQKYMIPKCYLIDWLCSDDYNNTNRKSRRHIDMLWEAQKWRD